jgi:SAM-dependent methyltransferase
LSPSVTAELPGLAAALRRAGLRESLAIAAYGGATGVHAARLASDQPRSLTAITAATAALELLVAGRSIDREAASSLPVDRLIDAGAIAADGDRLTPRLRIIPHRGRLLVCGGGALPDDSSFHLLGALPRRCDRWLDVGTGCGFAPLMAPRLGGDRLGTDIDASAIDGARLGARLAGLAGSLRLAVADLFDAAAGDRFDLITFNAPLPLPAGLLDRFWSEAPRHLAPGGLVVVHARGTPADLPGALDVARYTPDDCPEPFAVCRWRPGDPGRRRELAVELTLDAPHVSRAVFERC